MTSCVYLIGINTANSPSPAVHNACFSALRIDATYRGVDLRPEQLESIWPVLRASECLGANVTAPFKPDAAAVADALSDEASACGAANVLLSRGGRLVAHNTDVVAMLAHLEARCGAISRGAAVILGAGGAARAACRALEGIRPTAMIIAADPADGAPARGGGELASDLRDRGRPVRWRVRGGPRRSTACQLHAARVGAVPTCPPCRPVPSSTTSSMGSAARCTSSWRLGGSASPRATGPSAHLLEQCFRTYSPHGHGRPRETMRLAFLRAVGHEPATWT